jgi:hypothetical protein
MQESSATTVGWGLVHSVVHMQFGGGLKVEFSAMDSMGIEARLE